MQFPLLWEAGVILSTSKLPGLPALTACVTDVSWTETVPFGVPGAPWQVFVIGECSADIY